MQQQTVELRRRIRPGDEGLTHEHIIQIAKRWFRRVGCDVHDIGTENFLGTLDATEEQKIDLLLSLDPATKKYRLGSDLLVRTHSKIGDFHLDGIGDSRPGKAWRRFQVCEFEKAELCDDQHLLAAAWWEPLTGAPWAGPQIIGTDGRPYRLSMIRIFRVRDFSPAEIWLCDGHPKAGYYTTRAEALWPGVPIRPPRGVNGNDRDPKVCFSRADIEETGIPLRDACGRIFRSRLA